MSLETRVIALAQAIGDDVQALKIVDGLLSNLTTTDKTNLVAAINEVRTQVLNAGAGDMLNANNLANLADAAAARANLDVNSSGETTAEITAAIAALGALTEAEVDARVQLVVDAAPAALDTLNELAAAIGDDANFAATVTAALTNKVSFDVPQTLTAAQQLQASTNIGVGNPEHDFVVDYETARDN